MIARACGPCSACCTVDPVIPLNKPANTVCPRMLAGETAARGCCGDYENRPGACRQYSCEWLNGHGNFDERPDISGVVAEIARDAEGNPVIAVLMPSPGFTEASPGFQRAVAHWKRQGAIVLTASCDYVTREEAIWLRDNVAMRFADGVIMTCDEFTDRQGAAAPPAAPTTLPG